MKKYILLFFVYFLFVNFSFAVPSLDAYGRLPEVERMELSPSGKRYAFIASSGENRRVGVVENGKAVFAGELGDVKVRDIQWAGENHLLMKMSTTFDSPLEFTAAYELCTMMNIDVRTGKITSIFERYKRIAPVMLRDAGTRYIEGVPYKYFIGMAYGRGPGTSGYFFDGDHRNLYRANLETGDIDLQASGSGTGPGYIWAVGPDGNVLAHSIYEKSSASWRLYAGVDKEKLLLEHKSIDGRRSVSLLGPGRSPGTVWVLDVTGVTSVLEEISVADGRREQLFNGAKTDDVLRDLDSGLAIGASLVEEPHGTLFDAKLQARFAGMLKAFPGQRVQFLSYSRNFDRMIVRTDGGADSGTYWLVDIASGSADPIGRMYPEVGAKDVGPVRWVNYKSGDGKEITGRLTLPVVRGIEKLPLVVLNSEQALLLEEGLGFNWLAQAFSSAGYAVFEPGVPLQNDAEPLSEDRVKHWQQTYDNTALGIQELVAQGVVDSTRACIVGLNTGGYAALAAVTLQPGPYRCSVALAAPANLPAHLKWTADEYGFDSPTARRLRKAYGPEKDLSRLSPVNFAGNASAPIMLLHGKDDTEMPFSQSEKMAAALRAAGKPVELVELVDEDHWLSRGGTRKAMLKASIDFVKKHNPPN